MRLNAAHRLRFCRMGSMYGAVTVTSVIRPRIAVVTEMILK